MSQQENSDEDSGRTNRNEDVNGSMLYANANNKENDNDVQVGELVKQREDSKETVEEVNPTKKKRKKWKSIDVKDIFSPYAPSEMPKNNRRRKNKKGKRNTQRTEYPRSYEYTFQFYPGAYYEMDTRDAAYQPSLFPPTDLSESQIKELILKQVEYYFTTDNLVADIFLRGQMDKAGFVNLNLLATFNRIKSLTSDVDLIREALQDSKELEVTVDGVRKRGGWEFWILPEASPGSYEPYYGEHGFIPASHIQELGTAPFYPDDVREPNLVVIDSQQNGGENNHVAEPVENDKSQEEEQISSTSEEEAQQQSLGVETNSEDSLDVKEVADISPGENTVSSKENLNEATKGIDTISLGAADNDGKKKDAGNIGEWKVASHSRAHNKPRNKLTERNPITPGQYVPEKKIFRGPVESEDVILLTEKGGDETFFQEIYTDIDNLVLYSLRKDEERNRNDIVVVFNPKILGVDNLEENDTSTWRIEDFGEKFYYFHKDFSEYPPLNFNMSIRFAFLEEKGFTYTSFTNFKEICLQQNGKSGRQPDSQRMTFLYLLWSHFLGHFFKRKYYKEFKSYALDDFRKKGSEDGIRILIDFYYRYLTPKGSPKKKVPYFLIEHFQQCIITQMFKGSTHGLEMFKRFLNAQTMYTRLKISNEVDEYLQMSEEELKSWRANINKDGRKKEAHASRSESNESLGLIPEFSDSSFPPLDSPKNL